MKNYIVTLTISIEAEDEQHAREIFGDMTRYGDYDCESVEVELDGFSNQE